MTTTLSRRLWSSAGAAIFLIVLSSAACAFSPTLVETHGFSNLVLDNGILWFGAGHKLYRGDLSQGTIAHIYDAEDVVITFVRLDGTRLYFGGHHSPSGKEGVIWSLDVNGGSIVWKQVFKDDWWRGHIVVPPLVDENVLILGVRTALYGIDKSSGKLRWTIDKNWFGTGEKLMPVLLNDQLLYGIANKYFGGDGSLSDRTIAVANPSSGTINRTIILPGKLGSEPAVHGKCLFVKDYEYYRQDDGGKLDYVGELRLNCLDLNSGNKIWTFQSKGVPASSRPSFYNGLVFDVFTDRLYAIDEQSGALRWQSPGLLTVAAENPQVIEELNLIAIEVPFKRSVIFLDLENGQIQDEEFSSVLSHPLFVGREAIYGTKNAIVIADTLTGNIVRSFPVESHYQVFADD